MSRGKRIANFLGLNLISQIHNATDRDLQDSSGHRLLTISILTKEQQDLFLDLKLADSVRYGIGCLESQP